MRDQQVYIVMLAQNQHKSSAPPEGEKSRVRLKQET